MVHIWTPYFLVDKTHQNLYFCYMSKHPKLNENSQFFLVFTCPVSHPNLSCPSSSTLLVGSFALLSTVDCIVRKRTHIRIETRLWHYVCHSSNPLLQRRLFALENPISVLLRFCFLFFFSRSAFSRTAFASFSLSALIRSQPKHSLQWSLPNTHFNNDPQKLDTTPPIPSLPLDTTPNPQKISNY